MKYGFVGRSNLIVSKVGLGTMSFGDTTPKDEAFRIMDKAVDMGINLFDTADVYNDGRAEEIIGEWLKERPGIREKVIIATKFYGHLYPGVPNEEVGVSMHKSHIHLEGSLKRLNTDYIDIYQSHHFDRHITDDEYWDMMQHNINSGKVLYAGTCNGTGWSLARLQQAAKQRNIFGFISEQSNYSLINRFVELEVLPCCKHFGIGVFSFMSLGGGILTCKSMAEAGARTRFVMKEYDYDPVDNPQLKAFSKACHELGEKENVVASAWTIHNPVVSSTLLGARVARHLDDVERVVELKLPEDFLKKLDEIFTYSNGRPLRPATEAPWAYAGLGSKEEYFIDYYRKEDRPL